MHSYTKMVTEMMFNSQFSYYLNTFAKSIPLTEKNHLIKY